MDVETAHKFSSNHRDRVLASKQVGCFHCLKTFSPAEIVDWIDNTTRPEGDTALCPHCGIDAVIGDADVPLSKALLAKMKGHWF